LKERSDLTAFAFFTNVSLTVTDKDSLISAAKTLGIQTCHLFDREHVRVLLDSADGFSARFQYLGIPLSDAEQAAFFAKWGSDVNNLIANSFHSIHNRLDRIEFNQERQHPLRSIWFRMHLIESTATEELPRFRALLAMVSYSGDSLEILQVLYLAIANDDGKWSDQSRDGQSTVQKFWINELKNEVSSGCSVRQNPLRSIGAHADLSTAASLVQLSLGDLHDNSVVFFANKALASRIQELEVNANLYRIWKASRSDLHFDKPMQQVRWPWALTLDEKKDDWVRIMCRKGTHVDFSSSTPQPLIDFSERRI
jgi:hypothetical protein